MDGEDAYIMKKFNDKSLKEGKEMELTVNVNYDKIKDYFEKVDENGDEIEEKKQAKDEEEVKTEDKDEEAKKKKKKKNNKKR